MTVTELREALACRPDQFGASSCSPKRLLLEEVREARLPAYFFDDGEQLVYLDDELYDLAEIKRAGGVVRALPREIIESGVGIEYGWRHTRHCGCRLCHGTTQAGSADAVA